MTSVPPAGTMAHMETRTAPEPAFLTIDEACVLGRWSRRYWYRHLHGKVIPVVKLGRHTRVPRAALQAYLVELVVTAEAERTGSNGRLTPAAWLRREIETGRLAAEPPAELLSLAAELVRASGVSQPA